MTKEELEKEAEEYAKGKGHEHYNYLFEKNAGTPATFANWCFKDGAEYGYNKANEWHYVKYGLPKDNEYVLIYTDLNNCYVAKKVENHFMSKGWGFIPMSTVIAWKEIVLPELKESE